MPFCPLSGDKSEFRPASGRHLHAREERPKPEDSQAPQPNQERVIWEGKALTVTYRVTTERVQILHSGLRRSTEEIELARLKDVQVEQSLAQRAMRTGDITIISSDATTPSITFREVSDPEGVKEKIRTAAREELERLTVQSYTPT